MSKKWEKNFLNEFYETLWFESCKIIENILVQILEYACMKHFEQAELNNIKYISEKL